MFVDEIEITLKAGNGGDGKASFFPGYKSGPDGGSGGNGGNITSIATSDLSALHQFSGKKMITAPSGEDGQKFRKTGSGGEDITLRLPLGSTIKDKDTDEIFELYDINQKIVICRGGLGGKGTYALRSPSNTTPRLAERGVPGQKRQVKIVLRLIADYGFIGLPNAGKSSLLNELTSAHVKVANYPFTTIEPNLGVMDGKILADIPGLIEGASMGKGLGIKFLKHVEKVNLLLHCIGADSEDVAADYTIVRKELGTFNKILIQKPEIILLTKSDIIPRYALVQKRKILQHFAKVFTVSIHDWDSLQKLRKHLLSI